jgi:hypothetical protein
MNYRYLTGDLTNDEGKHPMVTSNRISLGWRNGPLLISVHVWSGILSPSPWNGMAIPVEGLIHTYIYIYIYTYIYIRIYIYVYIYITYIKHIFISLPSGSTTEVVLHERCVRRYQHWDLIWPLDITIWRVLKSRGIPSREPAACFNTKLWSFMTTGWLGVPWLPWIGKVQKYLVGCWDGTFPCRWVYAKPLDVLEIDGVILKVAKINSSWR